MAAVDTTRTAAAAAAPLAPATRDRLGAWLTAGAVANGAMAATYVAFSVYVMPMLGRKDDAGFVHSMQQINVNIENPLFFAAFFGASVFPAVAAWKQRKKGGGSAMKWAAAAAALYTAGVLTTMGINVPLNEALAAAGDTDPSAARADFEGTWNVWNAVRAVLSTAAFAASVQSLRLFRRNRV
ncbi:anthrone oxygenase family protein [Yinghuangia soli]|uniref:DUF1772 domain-containing protein n=1 Tax=Yinghuangia soli TaxID=2908204 RepID=A0AA41PWX7_9ACTN|nr:anthrone oxygenase family protein [Yinghuangia soli]MCF2526701.1 DUF1772 domain-containing protein [Yinghuangia soli]